MLLPEDWRSFIESLNSNEAVSSQPSAISFGSQQDVGKRGGALADS